MYRGIKMAYYRTDKSRALWDRVDDLRGRMSVRELAEKAGLNESSLQTTRACGTMPKLETLYPISKALGTTMEWLFAGDNITNNYDAPLFQKLSQSQDLIDICEALVSTATQEDIMLCKRVLGVKPRVQNGGGRFMTLLYKEIRYVYCV